MLSEPALDEQQSYGSQKLWQGAKGAAGGAAGRALGSLIGGASSPKVQTLIEEGVPLTPGRMLGNESTAGKALAMLEDASTSIPLYGTAVKQGQQASKEGYNIAIANRVLKPLGEEVPKGFKAGRELVARVGKTVDDAWDRTVGRMHLAMDAQLATELGALRNLAQSMPPDRAAQFDSIISDRFLSRLTGGGRMSGETLSTAQSELRRLASSYMSSPDADQRLLGAALVQAREIVNDAMARSSGPAIGKEFANVRKAYAELLRFEKGASSVGAEEGVMSPAQYMSAVRALSPTSGGAGVKRQFARNKALGEDIADAGAILRQSVADSGTVPRGLMSGGLGAAAYAEPVTAAAVAAGLYTGGQALYNPLSQKMLELLIARRPEFARQLGRFVTRGVAPVTAAGAAQQ